MKRFLLPTILCFACLIRISFLSSYPIGFTADEASFGYDAYSILKTGKDQWGHTLPLVLESFGDFKAPLYSYLDIPFIGIFGLTKFATRILGAILGTGAVYVVYLLVKELVREKKTSLYNLLPIVSTLFLTISPWHIQLSRGAFESNLTTFFLPLGILFFLKGLKSPKFLYVSALAFGLNLFSYHSAKVVTPLIIFVLIFVFWKELQLQKFIPKLKFAAIFFVFFALTLVTFFQGAGRRAADVSILNGAGEVHALDRLRAEENGMNHTIARIWHNKYFVVADRFWNNYRSYFSFDFLFGGGPREGTYGMVQGIPVAYLFELPLLIIFLGYAGKHYKEKHVQLIFLWLLIGPIPASLTQGVGLAGNRAATMMPALQIASAMGFCQMCMYVGTKIKQYKMPGIRLGQVAAIYIIAISFVTFLKNYFLYAPLVHAKPMLYGNLEASTWITQNSDGYSQVRVGRSLSEPHIFIAFAQKWNPKDYQKETEKWRVYRTENMMFLDQLNGYRLGKYVFGDINQKTIMGESTLIMGRPNEFPKDITPLKEFYYPDKTPSIYIIPGVKDVYAYQFR